MNKLLLLFLFTCYFTANAQKQSIKERKNFNLPAGITSKDYIPGRVIVKFKPVASASKNKKLPANAAQKSSLPQLSIKSTSILSIIKKFAETESPAVNQVFTEMDNSGIDRIYEVKFSGSADIEQVINEILEDPRVEYAEPSYIYHSNYTPNDPSYTSGGQSYLNQIKAPQAWDIIRNSSGVIIAIVDSGSDFTHPDLAANIYLNTADPINGIDDDNDGYIDNYRGWDFVGASVNQITEDNDPAVKEDDIYHGVHVSGIASAVSDNNTGVASVAFNARLMIVKTGADDNSSAIYRGYDGIKYAADHGANIINCSWGGTGGGAFGADIVNYAIAKGCLITAAAGNNNSSVPDYPAGYPGVIAVANVGSSDVKNNSSNYGSYVSISAPGNGILSTFPNGTYGISSGTSMSSPVVASAAALVKSYFPALSMQQVGERLRATADRIDAQNPDYTGLLGSGRLNVYRALTETPPSVRNQKLTIANNGNTGLPAGDTAILYFDLKNFLSPVSGLQVTLTSVNSNVTVTAPGQFVQAIATLQTKQLVGPFKVYIKPGTPDNTNITFKINYQANNGTYLDAESFVLTVSLDYLNITANKISTTLTSNGRIGFSSVNSTNGLGFSYLNQQMLYESALMIGTSSSQVSNNAPNGNANDEHFVKKLRATRVSTPGSTFEGRSEFDDSNNPNSLNVYIKHRQVAYASAPDDKYTIAEYEVINNSNTDLKGVYIGLLTDWDIDNGNNNVTRYDPVNRVGYVFKKTGDSPYAAVKLLSTNASPAYYPLSYLLNGDLLADGVFTIAEKFQTLSSGVKSLSLGDNSASGYDVMFLSGYGPYSIPAKGSVKAAFALIGGDDIADIQNSAFAAQIKYNQIKTDEQPISQGLELKQNYPNPFPAPSTESTTVEYSIPTSGYVSLSLYDLLGRKVKTYINELVSAGPHTLMINPNGLENGIYFYRIRYNNEEKTLKMVVSR